MDDVRTAIKHDRNQVKVCSLVEEDEDSYWPNCQTIFSLLKCPYYYGQICLGVAASVQLGHALIHFSLSLSHA